MRIKSSYNNVNDEFSPKVNQLNSDTLTYFTVLFGVTALLDTGAEINVIQEEALGKIPTENMRHETRRITRAQNASCETVEGLGTVEIRIQGCWNKFQIWRESSAAIIIGQPVICGEVFVSHRNRIMMIENSNCKYIFTLIPKKSIRRNQAQAINEKHKLVLRHERLLQPGVQKIYYDELQRYSGSAQGQREFQASATLINTRGIVTANQLYRDGEEPIIYICAKRPTVLPAGTDLGVLKRIQATEKVKPLVQSLIDFASLDSPLENPPPCPEQQPNWRTETRSEADIRTDPKYIPYDEARFDQVWKELKVSMNPFYNKMEQKEKDELISVIKKYLHVWAKNLAPMEGVEHHIDTGDAIHLQKESDQTIKH